jgi:NADH-quinone oxidoreductase subunit M
MQDFGYPVLTTLIVLPLIAAAVMYFIKSDTAIRAFTFVVGLLECLVCLPLFHYDMTTADFQFVEKAAWLPQWGISYYLGVDGISLYMVMLSALLLPLCVLCSWTYIGKRIKEFHFCLLLMTTASVGVFAALDFVLFYVFWEALLVPMYLLIAVWGGPRRRYASIKFFLYTLAGSTLLLVAIVAFWKTTGTFSIPDLMNHTYPFRFQFWAFLAMALAFAIKVPMFPFHTWLPAAHVEAPSAGSVILAAVLLKMGSYGFMRFCLPLTPDASVYFGPMMIAVSIASILYGGFIALGQKDVKKLIAYSSVGHMGFVTLGIFLFNKAGIQGALLQMLNHGITTGAMFMMIGTMYERSHSREIADNLGLGKYLPAFMFFWGLFALSSLGFPGTNSFVGEAFVLIGSFTKNTVVGFLAIPGAMLAAAYMLRLSLKLAWGQPRAPKSKYWPDLNAREWFYLAPMAVLVVYIGLAPTMAIKLMDPSIDKLVSIMKPRAAVTYQIDAATLKNGG